MRLSSYQWQATDASAQVIASSTQPVFRFRPGNEGRYTVSLVRTDTIGTDVVSGSASVDIDVVNVAPVIRFPGDRIDSPPTIYRGRVLFGSADGWVYCLLAADGEKLAQLQLDAPPVFDGLTAAAGRLYLTTTIGKLVCLQGK